MSYTWRSTRPVFMLNLAQGGGCLPIVLKHSVQGSGLGNHPPLRGAQSTTSPAKDPRKQSGIYLSLTTNPQSLQIGISTDISISDYGNSTRERLNRSAHTDSEDLHIPRERRVVFQPPQASFRGCYERARVSVLCYR